MNETKNKILISAKELFNDYGYKKVSMDEIAANANVTKKTVYTYYKDKETLLKTIIEEEIIDMKNIIEKYSTDETLSFFEILNKTIYQMLDYKKHNKLLLKLNKESSLDIENAIKKIDESIKEFIKTKLQQIKTRKEIKNIDIDIDLCSFIIYKVYVAIMFEYNKEINEKEITKTVTSILKTGLFREETKWKKISNM